MSAVIIRRLTPNDAELALAMLSVMARTFEEGFESPPPNSAEMLSVGGVCDKIVK
jgi:hypothetical protein